VLAALHGIGADLGDPVEVKRDGAGIVVGGVGIAQERQRQIHAALDAQPNVSIRFSNPPSETAAAEPAPTEPSVVPSLPTDGLSARLEKQLGGHNDFEKFSSQILDRNERLMSRAYALRRLAERFQSEAQMTPEDRKLLHELARQHADEMARDAAAMEHSLRPLLTAMGAKPAPALATPATDWQGEAQDSFRASHRVEVLVSELLGVSNGSTTPTDILAALNELHAKLDSCQKMLQ
jgi:hypothetical protein